MHITDSFKPSVTFKSGSSYPSAIESSNLKKVEKVLLKRKVVHVEGDFQAFRAQQNVLVSAFSKTLARNLHMSVEANEEMFLKRQAKQLVKQAEFGKGFKLGNGRSDMNDGQNLNLDTAIKNYQFKDALL